MEINITGTTVRHLYYLFTGIVLLMWGIRGRRELWQNRLTLAIIATVLISISSIVMIVCEMHSADVPQTGPWPTLLSQINSVEGGELREQVLQRWIEQNPLFPKTNAKMINKIRSAFWESLNTDDFNKMWPKLAAQLSRYIEFEPDTAEKTEPPTPDDTYGFK